MENSPRSIAIILAILFSQFQATAEVKFNNLSISQAMVQAKVEHKKVFVVFSSAECSPCKWMEANVYKDSLFSQLINSNFVTVKSNGYTVNGKYEVMHYKVYTLPTVIFFDENGEELHRIEGKRDLTQMSEISGQVLSGTMGGSDPKENNVPIPLPRKNEVILPMNPSLNSSRK